MIGLIVASGEIKNYKMLEKVAKTSDYIICADGGSNHIIKTSVKPDLIIGDLDSIEKETLNKLKNSKIEISKFPREKDFTDTELAVEYLISKNVDKIIFMGVLGTRIDHTLANILLLNNLLDRGIQGKIIGEKNTIFINDSTLKLKKEENTFVSVIPITNEGARITLKGFEYETNEEKFTFASSYGISNRIVEETGIITIKQGRCLIVISKD